MAIFIHMTKADAVDEINAQIERCYPGKYFDFTSCGLPEDWVEKIHNEGFCVEAIYSRSDSGEWGTFLQISEDFLIEEPEERETDQVWEEYETNLARLDRVMRDWGEKFASEL